MACAVAASCIGVYASVSEHAQARIFFVSALTEAHINEAVVVGGVTYRVHDGAAYAAEGTLAPDSIQEIRSAMAKAGNFKLSRVENRSLPKKSE